MKAKRDFSAIVKIYDARKMTQADRRVIARWLRQVGAKLIVDGDYYHTVFCSRYMGKMEHK